MASNRSNGPGDSAERFPPLPPAWFETQSLDAMLAGPSEERRKQAQEVAWEAMDVPNLDEMVTLARKALDIYPDCAEAMTLIADEAAVRPSDRLAYAFRAVYAGERLLASRFLWENRRLGLWGISEARPYLNARVCLASLLLDLGRTAEATGEFETLVWLDPDHFHDLRWVLVGCYFLLGRMEDARSILQSDEDGQSTVLAWARVLERFVSGDVHGAEQALTTATAANSHVGLYLIGRRRMPRKQADGYALGSVEEAVMCADILKKPWRQHRDAVTWLASMMPPPVTTPAEKGP